MLTRDRLRKIVLDWWRESSLVTISENQVTALADKLEDGVVEIAKEAHQRGLEGKAF